MKRRFKEVSLHWLSLQFTLHVRFVFLRLSSSEAFFARIITKIALILLFDSKFRCNNQHLEEKKIWWALHSKNSSVEFLIFERIFSHLFHSLVVIFAQVEKRKLAAKWTYPSTIQFQLSHKHFKTKTQTNVPKKIYQNINHFECDCDLSSLHNTHSSLLS